MKCAIMQPAFLPWVGYFNLISGVDNFVFLDDAQLQKNSWHNRNRILVNQNPHWISVPVKREKLGQTIAETKLDNSQRWRSKHVKLLQQVYSKHPFSKNILELCDILQKDESLHLAELNIRLIRWFLLKLEIPTTIFLSSDLNAKGKRTERIINILKEFNADCYLSPKGAKEYLEEDGFLEQTFVKLEVQNFEPLPYRQHKKNEFESYLSIVDVLANLGWPATKRYLYQEL
tara:strand:+ start:82 stop:774 length:693 start_codon:yes stop_codon:yes gene_type:complete